MDQVDTTALRCAMNYFAYICGGEDCAGSMVFEFNRTDVANMFIDGVQRFSPRLTAILCFVMLYNLNREMISPSEMN